MTHVGVRLGPYLVLERIGAGGMGTVYLAQGGEGRRVALKVLHPHLVEEPGFLRRIRAEGVLGRRVRHPNVVATLDAAQVEVDGTALFYLATEYVEGQTLRSLLTELGRVPEELCLHIGREVACGLEAIHAAGIVHRDLKPENVMITKDHAVKVMDLGVARSLRGTIQVSEAGSFAGTVLYAAPEQFTTERFDGRADLYALGLVLYELTTGRHPFQGADIPGVIQSHLHARPTTISEHEPQASAFLEALVDCLLAKDPAHRFPGAAALRVVLEEGEQSTWWRERACQIRAATHRPLRRVRVPRETALLGREEELRRLEEAWAAVRAGSGRAVLVEGEAGIGKTRLCDEFVTRRLEGGESMHFLFGAYLPGGGASGSGAFSTAYREHFAGEDLAQALARYMPETPTLAPAFAALLRGEPPPPDAPAISREALPSVFRQVTAALAGERPVIVLLDDLQFAPREGRALLAALAAELSDRPVMLIGTLRPGLADEDLAALGRLPHALRLALPRLGAKDLTRLLVDALGSQRLAEELGFRIAQKSDGNPFFALEIVRSLREGRYLEQQPDGTWIRTRTIERIAIPSSVLDLIRARIEELEAEERDLMEVASCCGPQFDPGLVAEALGLEIVPALKRFAAIERRHRLIRSVGRGCVFDHHQVREALYDGLLPQLREHYHRMVAEAIERRAGEAGPTGAVAVQACEHYLRSATPERAPPLFQAAFRHIERGYGNEAPIALADLALGQQQVVTGRARVDLLLRKAGYLDLAGRRLEQRAALDEARALAAGLGDAALQARIDGEIGWLLTQTADYEEAHALLVEALRLARQADRTDVESIVSGYLGVWMTDRRRYDEAESNLDRQLELARADGDRKGEASALCNLGNVQWHRGRLDRAEELYDRHLALARELGDRRGEAIALGNLGNVAFDRGELEKARALHRDYLDVAREIGYRRGEARALGALGIDARRLGRYAEAEEHYRRYLDLSRAIRNRLGEAFAQLNLARLRILLGDHDEAGSLIAAGLERLEEIGARHAVAYGLELKAELARARGDRAAALELYERALEQAERAGPESTAAATRLALGAMRDDDALLASLESTARDGVGILAACHRARIGRRDAAEVAATLAVEEARLDLQTRLEAHHLLAPLHTEGNHAAQAAALLDEVVRRAPAAMRAVMVERIPLYRAVDAARP